MDVTNFSWLYKNTCILYESHDPWPKRDERPACLSCGHLRGSRAAVCAAGPSTQRRRAGAARAEYHWGTRQHKDLIQTIVGNQCCGSKFQIHLSTIRILIFGSWINLDPDPGLGMLSILKEKFYIILEKRFYYLVQNNVTGRNFSSVEYLIGYLMYLFNLAVSI